MTPDELIAEIVERDVEAAHRKIEERKMYQMSAPVERRAVGGCRRTPRLRDTQEAAGVSPALVLDRKGFRL